ncbi:NAD(P)-dependent oxidoreductase [Microbaculum marinum]|uniref:NAD(P)-dependent oxidoreductase n=1 Tax=Microbaculum marinum TaxID=1764581 RepID=A0AAW9RKH5_9HYPH
MSESDGRKIAFVGLGNMGFPMARNLVRRGFDLTVFDERREVSERFRDAHGAGAAASPSEAFRGSDVIVLMLPNGNIVQDVLLASGDAGAAIESANRGCVVIDMSSSDPLGTRNLSAMLRERGAHLIDAPVSGGVAKAVNGQLTAMVGGDVEVAKGVEPILQAMASTVLHVGPSGAGHAIKALNNYVSAAGLLAACEAVRTAREFGIDGELAVQVLNASTGRNNSTENKISQHVLSEAFKSGFSMGLMSKDLATASRLSRELNLHLPLADSLVGTWEKAAASFGPDADHTEIARMVIRS